MLWIWIGLGVVVGLPLVLAGAGSMLPRGHVARGTIELSAPPERVFALISDFPGTTRWRAGVKAIDPRPGPDGTARFEESSKHGKIPFEVVSQAPPRRQVVRVVDDDQPFGGTWTWEIEPAPAGSRLTITEDGFVKNPIFRLLGRFFFSPTATIDAYLRDLARELGESASPSVSTGAR